MGAKFALCNQPHQKQLCNQGRGAEKSVSSKQQNYGHSKKQRNNWKTVRANEEVTKKKRKVLSPYSCGEVGLAVCFIKRFCTYQFSF